MKVTVTGIQPTGSLHLGNYLGMIQPALALAEQYEALYFIADYHALTSMRSGKDIRDLTYEVAATWLALGLDPARSILYRQSDVPEVTELAWILDCVTSKGLMNRAHAYKAAVAENRQHDRDPDTGVNLGLYTYPVLMAADILFPGAHVVPVGLDQRQHIEIAQDIAEAFNASYGSVLTLPEALIDERVMTIPGIDGRKMSKSYGNASPILKPTEVLRKAVMRIKTDSRRPEEPKDPETDVIFQLFRHIAPPAAVDSMAERYRSGRVSYAETKQELFQTLNVRFAVPRERYQQTVADRQAIDGILKDGAERVRAIGTPILSRVRTAIGVGG